MDVLGARKRAITNNVVVLFAILSLVAIVQCWREKIRLGFSLRAGAPRELLVGFGICVLAWAGIFLVGGRSVPFASRGRDRRSAGS